MAAAEGTLVSSVLKQYGDATRRVLFEYLPAAEPRRYLYDLVADYPRRGGRAFRPSLCIATARAFGSPMEVALCTAVSIELMHNAMLIHDDIEDESEQRRGKPAHARVRRACPSRSTWATCSLCLSMRPLLDNRRLLGPELSLRILEETERMARESAEGQALELGWRRDNVDRRSPRRTICRWSSRKPAGWRPFIPAAWARSSARSGRWTSTAASAFGFFLGAAFQIQDDLLNLEGDPDSYGKELGGDIREGKRTLMLIHLWANSTDAERVRLREMLGQPRECRSEPDVTWVRERMDSYGCLDYARQVAQGLAGAARYEFTGLYGHLPDSMDRRFLEALPTWVIERN